ncbi:hypothetical protein Leryth_016736 [Lithospermum erythrorhizon]|nr:hypothetical protein Leryth_016736 [Lithospermum erythrorhizon]
MDVFDDTGRVTAGGMDLIVEQILQTTARGPGLKYKLDSTRVKLENKKFSFLLRRTYSRKAGGARRLLLVAFFDDSVG